MSPLFMGLLERPRSLVPGPWSLPTCLCLLEGVERGPYFLLWAPTGLGGSAVL